MYFVHGAKKKKKKTTKKGDILKKSSHISDVQQPNVSSHATENVFKRR